MTVHVQEIARGRVMQVITESSEKVAAIAAHSSGMTASHPLISRERPARCSNELLQPPRLITEKVLPPKWLAGAYATISDVFVVGMYLPSS
jgi:hypothetical protein